MDIHRIESAVLRTATVTFARSGGPGGQNVNKVSSKAVLRLPLGRFASIAGIAGADLDLARAKLGRRLNDRGDLVVSVQDTRDQAKNREIAVHRATELVAAALRRPRRRLATRPSARSREARIAAKVRRGAVKRLRSGRPEEE